ncbi:MAG: VTT domain-containing protein [Nitrospirae bacterium]|jgi:membrane protein DedA with SNARE-associated domain|nr:VTT domain-containing protein [Nitrospirota bacterium]
MYLSSITGHFPYLGLFILLLLGGIGFPFPEGVTLILCGLLISSKVIQPVYALVIVYSGVLIGDYLFYSFGRKYGRMIIKLRGFRKVLPPHRLEMLENKFNKYGILFILIGGRLIGEIFLVAGILKMPRIKFLVIDLLSSLLTVIVWVGVGYVGGHTLQIIKKDILRIEHITVFFIVSIVIYLFFRHIFWSRKY